MVKGLIVYSDYVCPFCYLAWPGVRALVEEGWEVSLRAFELRPPELPLALRPSAEKRAAWDAYVAPRAAALGLPATFPSIMPRTRKAHEAAKHAEAKGVGLAFHDRLFKAYFADGLDIGRIDVLVGLGQELGLDATEMKVELDIDQYTARVVADEAAAYEAGIGAVPAYVFGSRVQQGLIEGLGEWVRDGQGGG